MSEHHTKEEIYAHRYRLWIALCRQVQIAPCRPLRAKPWRSKLHADGTMFDDSFILGMTNRKGEPLSYHLPLKYWDECDFARTLDRAPEWDGYTPDDVLERLRNV